jgi:DeoR/GlpR family transcriptional regulator of sugar metabolism
MLKEERQQLILEILHTQGKVVATDLSALLQVSEDTIRRDLRELANTGRLTRVHGGGLPRSPAAVSYAERVQQSPVAKAAIADVAANLIHDGQVVILDGGTTTLKVARALPPGLRATIVTSSLPVAMELAEHDGIEVVMIGGQVFKFSLVTIGAQAVESYMQVRADLCMLGICSLHPEAGITTPDYEENLVKRAMVAGAAQVVALASHEKLGTACPFVVGPINILNSLLIDRGLPAEMLQPYRDAGVEVIEAG